MLSNAVCAVGRTIGSVVGLMVMISFACGIATRSAGAQEQGARQDGLQIDWQIGPTKARMGDLAEIRVPAGYRFTGAAGTQELLQLMENPVAGNEVGLLAPTDEEAGWFVVFEFQDIGYVKDDEQDQLDADAILKSIRDATEQANEERRRRGWATMEILGWERPPAYNATTNNLTWAIRGRSEGELVVNYNTRLLGRTGVMSANLVVSPAKLASVLPEFESLLGGYAFQPGKKYSEFRAGDRVAEYGLAALVTGGAAAVAAKAGLFKKLWKLIVVAVVGAGALLKKLFGGGKQSTA